MALLAQAQASDAAAPRTVVVRRTPRPGAHAIVLAWFSLGVLTSGALGVGSLFGLKALAARGTPLTWEALATTVQRGAEATVAAAWSRMPTVPLLTPPAVTPPTKQPAVPPKWDVVRMPIERGTHGAALGLQVTGTADLPIELVLDGVPAGVRLSRGAPIGPTTWVLGQEDLADLSLTLDDTAPDAFDIKIAVVAPRDVATVGSVVQVRMVDGGAPVQVATESVEQRTAETETAPLTMARPAAGRGADDLGQESSGLEKKAVAPAAPRRTAASATAAPAATTAAAPSGSTAATRVWPEGAYGLGAVSREPEPEAPAEPPAWSPFREGAQ